MEYVPGSFVRTLDAEAVRADFEILSQEGHTVEVRYADGELDSFSELYLRTLIQTGMVEAYNPAEILQ